MSDRIEPYVARAVARDAGCRDVDRLCSFLVHCRDSEEARRTVEILRANPATAEMFNGCRPVPARRMRRQER
jgi:hypothetical protein